MNLILSVEKLYSLHSREVAVRFFSLLGNISISRYWDETVNLAGSHAVYTAINLRAAG